MISSVMSEGYGRPSVQATVSSRGENRADIANLIFDRLFLSVFLA